MHGQNNIMFFFVMHRRQSFSLEGYKTVSHEVDDFMENGSFLTTRRKLDRLDGFVSAIMMFASVGCVCLMCILNCAWC